MRNRILAHAFQGQAYFLRNPFLNSTLSPDGSLILFPTKVDQ